MPVCVAGAVCLSVAGLQVLCCVCAVVSLCALVCVAVMAALWCCLQVSALGVCAPVVRCVAGFALCGAAGVRCGCAVGVRLYATLCAVCVLCVNKNKHLREN